MIQNLLLRFLMIRLWVFDVLCRVLFLENAKDSVLKKAENMLTGMKEHVDFLMEKID